jgi:hypothetical protein
MPVPVAMRSKAWFCGRSSADFVGSNPSGFIHLSLIESTVCSLVEDLFHELDTRPEKSYRLWCLVCDLKTHVGPQRPKFFLNTFSLSVSVFLQFAKLLFRHIL